MRRYTTRRFQAARSLASPSTRVLTTKTVLALRWRAALGSFALSGLGGGIDATTARCRPVVSRCVLSLCCDDAFSAPAGQGGRRQRTGEGRCIDSCVCMGNGRRGEALGKRRRGPRGRGRVGAAFARLTLAERQMVRRAGRGRVSWAGATRGMARETPDETQNSAHPVTRAARLSLRAARRRFVAPCGVHSALLLESRVAAAAPSERSTRGSVGGDLSLRHRGGGRSVASTGSSSRPAGRAGALRPTRSAARAAGTGRGRPRRRSATASAPPAA